MRNYYDHILLPLVGYIMQFLYPKAEKKGKKTDWYVNMGFFESLMILQSYPHWEEYERHFRKYE